MSDANDCKNFCIFQCFLSTVFLHLRLASKKDTLKKTMTDLQLPDFCIGYLVLLCKAFNTCGFRVVVFIARNSALSGRSRLHI